MSGAPRFGHIVLRTNRLAAMRDWYSAVLGARVVASAEAMVFLSYDDEHHRVALVDDRALVAPRDDVPGLAHVAFAHVTLGNLLRAFEGLRARGIAPVRAVNHRVTASLYYRDPDGNGVELFADCGPAEALVAAARDASPAWDPDALARTMRTGATEEELARTLATAALER